MTSPIEATALGPFTFLEQGCTETEENAGRPLTICDREGNDIANVYSRDDSTVPTSREQAIAYARLFAEAGTVAADTGLTPRQLAEQRADLLEALQNTLSLLKAFTRETDDVAKTICEQADAALAKAGAA